MRELAMAAHVARRHMGVPVDAQGRLATTRSDRIAPMAARTSPRCLFAKPTSKAHIPYPVPTRKSLRPKSVQRIQRSGAA